MSKFFKGVVLLALAAFASECIEFVVNMVLARELGERGLGMYMSILPTIFLIVLLASFELPISISKFIAEKDNKYHLSMLNHVIKLTTLFTAVLVPIAASIIPFISVFNEYHPLLRWIVIGFIPIVSFSSIARGFFMGKHQMGKIAASNFLRKAVQVLLLVVLYQVFQFDTNTAVLIAFCTFVGSEIVVFLYLVHMFIIQYQRVRKEPSQFISGKSVRHSLISVSVPTTALRVFHALTHAVQPFLIKGALLKAGVPGEIATEHFGMLAGVAMTIGFFPSFIAHSFLIMLIPTVSKEFADKNLEELRRLLQQVFFVTFLYGVPSVGLFCLFARPLTEVFFHSTDAAIYLQMLWPFFLLHFFIIPMQAYLIGMGLMKDAFYHSVWSTIVSFTAIFLLGSLHSLQMDGIIMGMNMGAVLLAMMHYVTVCRKIGLTLYLSPAKQFN
ncbi:polysaccharide biosynthesis protein [Cytobacillus sp. NCCP-133]|uniref:polysaccharide biosynthesis protein n=1 Tax=Cytobacillus sp. NCCP-133 TaxID=766848 RepID=UPI0022310823|nr:polysaccharide biosynthesis protein [Cytobacillus sp. NCCP-133]GLB59981.1 sporulation protein YkvU [Cytobacillus sp. NCCP-133]